VATKDRSSKIENIDGLKGAHPQNSFAIT